MSPLLCSVTVLRTLGGSYYATKRFVWDSATNEWTKTNYQSGSWFHPSEHPVSSLADLVKVIEETRRDPHAFVLRGALAPHAQEALTREPNRLFRRHKIGRSGRGEPPFVEASRYWICIDIDSFPLFASEDLADDPEGPIDRAIHELLPECFHDADCFWQLSSSAGFVDGVLKCHLWFWLSEAAENPHIKKVLEQHARSVDLSLYNAVQPHYIADPIVENGYDPLPRRTGFRNGIERAVTLPALIPEQRQLRPSRPTRSATGGNYNRSLENALARLGDGEGLDGFHEPLRSATMIYAGQCYRRYSNRDDEALKARIRELIEAAPKRPDRPRQNIENYQNDVYLDRLINGAFGVAATGDTDTPATMRPDVHAPTASVEQARSDLRNVICGFLERITAWWSAEEPRPGPEHAAVIVDVGVGKSAITREDLPAFIAAQEAAGQPHRVLWLVPHHRLSEETVEAMRALGLNAAIMKGREAKVLPDSDETMCRDLKAVQDATLVGADIEHDVCGSRKEGKARCPFYETCAYQRQKPAVEEADVIVAAHQHLFHTLPAAMGKKFALVVVDESWWQAGLNPGRRIKNPASFESEVIENPPLRAQQPDPLATQELQFLARKAEAAFAATPVGQFVTRATVVAAGLTADEARTAAKLEWLRKREPGIHPGMPAKDREKAVEDAKVNATLAQRSGVWHALAELLDSDHEASGRLEMAEGRNGVELLLHSRREIHAGTDDRPGPAALPILLLDATLPLKIVTHFLPRVEVLARVKVASPDMIVNQVIGGWGKSTLIPHSAASVEENQRRDHVLCELRDFVAFHTEQSGLVISYEQIINKEQRFASLPGIRTAWFNAITGLDAFGNVDALFVIGRPLPAPAELRALALALTGRVVPEESPGQTTHGALMSDGTGRPLKVRAYADPDLEALRSAITDAEVIQAIGRGRGVNRTASNPLTVWVLADVLLPLPLNLLARWDDVQLSTAERMAARGLLLSSPADAAAFYPELFVSPKGETGSRISAVEALRGISVGFPYENTFHRGIPHKSGDDPQRVVLPKSFFEIRYRPPGRGQQTRRAWVSDGRLPTIRDALEEALGSELVLFEVVGRPPPLDPGDAASVTHQPLASATQSELSRREALVPAMRDGGCREPRRGVRVRLKTRARLVSIIAKALGEPVPERRQ